MPKMRRFQSVTTTKKDILAEKLALCEKKPNFFLQKFGSIKKKHYLCIVQTYLHKAVNSFAACNGGFFIGW